MIEKWLHVEKLGGDYWILPIWAAVNDAISENRISSLPKNVCELGIHISIRLNILPRVASRIRAEAKQVFFEATKHKLEHEFSKDIKGVVLRIDNDLKYNLISDIDAFLFELNSVCELMKKLFEQLYSYAGQPIKKGKASRRIQTLIENSRGDSGWFQVLDNHRNFFIHEGAPYIAIDISGGPENYDLLIMKENLKEFGDPKKYFKLSELNEIVQGFDTSKPVIQENLVGLFK